MNLDFDNGQPMSGAHDFARLTFLHAGKCVRLTCDTDGTVLSTLRAEIGEW